MPTNSELKTTITNTVIFEPSQKHRKQPWKTLEISRPRNINNKNIFIFNQCRINIINSTNKDHTSLPPRLLFSQPDYPHNLQFYAPFCNGLQKR